MQNNLSFSFHVKIGHITNNFEVIQSEKSNLEKINHMQ